MARTAVIAGSTGLIGRECLRALLDNEAYERVVAVVRKPQTVRHAKYEEIVAGLDALGGVPAVRADDAFCVIGTTIRKAGSKDAFYAVDHDAVVNFAYWARSGEASAFCVVSSVGASPSSGSFYLATKGDMEMAVREQRFPQVEIFRPSVLVGAREENRPGERIAAHALRLIQPLLGGPLRKYRAVEAALVGRAMVRAALEESRGPRVHEYDEIVRLATSDG